MPSAPPLAPPAPRWIRPLPGRPLHAALTIFLFLVGTALAFLFLLSDSAALPLLAGLFVTLFYALWRWPLRGPLSRLALVLRFVALLVVIGAHALWAYEVFSFASELAWSVRFYLWVVIAALFLLSIITHLPRWKRAEVPFVLPAGLVIASCLLGWKTEETRIDCDDHLAAENQPSVRVLLPTSEEQAQCKAGEKIVIGRFPRHFWESADGERYVITTQLRNPKLDPLKPTPGPFSGSICVASRGESKPEKCFGGGTAQGIAESDELDRVFVANWAALPGGRRGGYVYSLDRRDPTKILGRAESTSLIGEVFYDPKTDTIGLLSDEGEFMIPFRASTLEPLEPLPTPVVPGDLHYDPARREGVYCFAAGPLKTMDGAPFGAVAFSMDPYRLRPLGPGKSYPWLWLGFSWGCDWDPEARRVYSAIASLGLLLTIDYDSTKILQTNVIGMGVRSVAYDKARRRVYTASYLSGWVKAIDLESGATQEKWFAGRFVRSVVLSRDGKKLFVTSTLGVVEISLE